MCSAVRATSFAATSVCTNGCVYVCCDATGLRVCVYVRACVRACTAARAGRLLRSRRRDLDEVNPRDAQSSRGARNKSRSWGFVCVCVLGVGERSLSELSGSRRVSSPLRAQLLRLRVAAEQRKGKTRFGQTQISPTSRSPLQPV